jgi:hypothetical protein
MVTRDIGQISTSKKPDHRVKTPFGKSQRIVAISLPTNGNALAAKHTAERIIGEEDEVDFLCHIPL